MKLSSQMGLCDPLQIVKADIPELVQLRIHFPPIAGFFQAEKAGPGFFLRAEKLAG